MWTGLDSNLQRRWIVASLGALLPLLALLIWQMLGDGGYISTLLFPTPSSIARTFVELTVSGLLWENLRISFMRAALGFGLGGGLGLICGLVVGMFRPAEKALDPTIQMLRMIPALALAPLFVIWFGIGEESKILLIAKGAFFPLYINAFLGVRNVDQKLYDVTRVLGFSRFALTFKVLLPAALPNILLGVRLSLGVAWLGLVVAELIASTSGIGYMMSDARQFGQTAIVYAGIIIFAVFGKLADSFVRALERRWLHWRDNFQGEGG